MRHYRVYFCLGRIYLSVRHTHVEKAVARAKSSYLSLYGVNGRVSFVERHHRDGSFIQLKAKKCLALHNSGTKLF